MPTTTTTVSRLQVDFPDLGYDPGVGLESVVKTAWTKFGDNMDSRFFTEDALADAASADFEHNFKTAFDELRVNLYERNTGTGELTRIETGGSPDLDDFTIVGTPGSLTTSVRITNNTGGAVDIAAVVVHGKGAEKLNDLDDVDTVSTPPVDNQALIWDSGSGNFIPGNAGLTLRSISSAGTLISNSHYLVDTSGGAFTADLPAGATGDVIRVTDATSSWATDNLTLDGDAAETIDGDLTLVCDVEATWVQLMWDGSGWVTDDAIVPSSVTVFDTPWQQRILVSSVNATTADIADLRFANLVIGRTYRVTFNADIQILGTSATERAVFEVKNDGTIVTKGQLLLDTPAGTERITLVGSMPFVAAATELTFDFTEAGTTRLVGTGTTTATFVVLEELPYHSTTTKWTP